MKITTLALFAAAVVACSKEKPAVKPTPTPTDDKPAAKADDKLIKQVAADQQVSPNLAISSDLVALCGIKPATTANPTFDYNKEDLTPEDRNVLDQLGTCLSSGALKGKAVSLVGRADARGTEEYNLGLGSRRASSVSKYLVRLGVKEPQLSPTTRGALDATGTDDAGYAKDRRVDVVLQQN